MAWRPSRCGSNGPASNGPRPRRRLDEPRGAGYEWKSHKLLETSELRERATEDGHAPPLPRAIRVGRGLLNRYNQAMRFRDNNTPLCVFLGAVMAQWSPGWCCCLSGGRDVQGACLEESINHAPPCHRNPLPAEKEPANSNPDEPGHCCCPNVSLKSDWSQTSMASMAATSIPPLLGDASAWRPWQFRQVTPVAEPPPDRGKHTLVALHCLLIV